MENKSVEDAPINKLEYKGKTNGSLKEIKKKAELVSEPPIQGHCEEEPINNYAVNNAEEMESDEVSREKVAEEKNTNGLVDNKENKMESDEVSREKVAEEKNTNGLVDNKENKNPKEKLMEENVPAEWDDELGKVKRPEKLGNSSVIENGGKTEEEVQKEMILRENTEEIKVDDENNTTETGVGVDLESQVILSVTRRLKDRKLRGLERRSKPRR